MTNNDLISREALKKTLEVTQYNDIDDLTRTERLIDDAPTIKPTITCKECDGYEAGYSAGQHEERPQGEWIEKVERRGCFAGDKTVYSYTCPFCGVKEFKKYPFCHCGADMREDAEND